MLSKNLHLLRKSIDGVTICSKFVRRTSRAFSVWTEEKVVKSSFKDIEIPKSTIYDYVWENLDKWPQRTVAVCGTTGRGYTYEQAFKLSNSFAANLRNKLKLRDGDTVAVMLPNVPDYPLVVMGILEAGGIVSTINPIYTAHEVQRQLVLSDAKIIIALPETVKVIKHALVMAKMDIPIITVKVTNETIPDGTIIFNELSEDVHVDTSCLKEVRRTADDISYTPYSSGTTGLPKGVELTHKNLIANCLQICEPEIRSENDTTATNQDSVIAALPLFHIYATTVIMLHKMAQGLKIVTLAQFKPESFLDILIKHKINLIFAAPPIVLMLASHAAVTPEHFQHINLINNGAAPMPIGDVGRIFEKAKREFSFTQGYGLTETSPVVTLMKKSEKNYSSVGYAVPSTDVKIVDQNLNSLGPEEVGELLVRGPQVMKGYRNNPEANKEVFTEDGWFRTGDLATINKTGAVFIADRLKELIKVKGFQVPPAELESVLREHPSVLDAAVVGVSHPRTGEAPKAFIVVRKDVKADISAIKDFVAERVAAYKRIDDVVVIDTIPKSAAGKILRRVIKEKYC